MSKTLTIRLNEELARWLAQQAKRSGRSQGEIVREQLEKARTAKKDKPWMKLAGSIKGGPPDLSSRKGYARW